MEQRQYYKCMTLCLPTAENVVFWEDNEGAIHHGGAFFRDDIQPTGEGYTNTMHGDSGSGLFISSIENRDDGSKEDRQIIIAVFVKRSPPPLPFGLYDGKMDVCENWVIKISEPIVSWLKTIESSVKI